MEWLPLPMWEEYYEVSSDGRLRSVVRKAMCTYGVRSYGGTELKPIVGTRGYLVVNVTGGGRRRQMPIHKAVALAFHGLPPSDAHEVCHNDGNKLNNDASNLRWDTRSNNHLDKRKHGTMKYGEKNPLCKIPFEEIEKMRFMYSEGYTTPSIAKLFGRGCEYVKAVCMYRTRVHG